MEAKEYLFKKQNSIEEKDPIKKQKEEISLLRKEFNEAHTKADTKSTRENWQTFHNIRSKLGQKYLDLARFIAKDSNTQLTSNPKSLVYIAEASKFALEEAIQTVYQIKDPILFLNTFLLMLDKTLGFAATSLATIWAIFFKIAPDPNSLTRRFWSQLHKHFIKFYMPPNVIDNLRPEEFITSEEIKASTTNFLTTTLDSVELNIETVYQLIQFSKDEQLISTTYIQAYFDYFFQFAKQHPEKIIALPSYEKIIYSISEIYFTNNEVLRDIECLDWLKEHQSKDEKGEKTINDEIFAKIFYERMLKCCKGPLFNIANEVSLGRLENFLQYFEAISINFIIKPTEDLFFAVKSLYDSCSFENMKIALTLTARICKAIPAEFSDTKDVTKCLSIEGKFIRFYKVRFQPDSMLSTILPVRLKAIEDHIKQHKLSSFAFFIKTSSSLHGKFEKLSSDINSICNPALVEWSRENKEKIAETKQIFTKVLSLLGNFQETVFSEELKALITKLKEDIIQLWDISPVFEPIEIELQEFKDNNIEKNNSDNIFDPYKKESKEEEDDDDASSALARHFDN